jgi:hypothetical protein
VRPPEKDKDHVTYRYASGITVECGAVGVNGVQFVGSEGRITVNRGFFQAEPEEHSPVIEGERAYVVFRLDSVQAGGVPPLASVQAEVEAKVRLQKKQAAARSLGERLATQADGSADGKGGTPLPQLAQQPGLSYRELGPFARLTAPLGSAALIGSAFSVEKGGIAGPVAGTDLGVSLLQVLERIPADSADFAKTIGPIRQEALQAARQSRVQAYLATLRAQARVVDRRAEIFRTSAQAAAATPTTPIP